MNAHPWRHEFDVALQAVRDAAVLTREIRQGVPDAAWLKPDASPVTVADFAVQALIAQRLGEAYPRDPLVAEEDASTLRTPAGQATLEAVNEALRGWLPNLDPDQTCDLIDRGLGNSGERFWTLDPVDGTQGFVRGDQYVVALALVVRGQVKVALLACPGLPLADGPVRSPGSIAGAVRNHGAFRTSLNAEDFVPLHVSSCREPGLSRVLRSFEPEHIDLATFAAILRALDIGTPPLLMDSQAKHAVIAAGQADLLIRIAGRPDYREKIWDQAAGSLIVEEAGGRVTDLRGRTLDFGAGRLLTRNEGVIASNGALHAAVVEAARQVMSSSVPPPSRG